MKSSITERLAAMGLVLPTAPKPVASYIPARRSGSLVFTAGQLPFVNGVLTHTGPVGVSPGLVTLEDAQACARTCVLNALAAASTVVPLGSIIGVVRVGVFVACEPGFADHPKVANGASDLLVDVFGQAGRHARAAVGCPSLPLNAPVEVDVVFEVA
jgi:enamine deaminase RidA (YjgF/YER057c/UK114 family)